MTTTAHHVRAAALAVAAVLLLAGCTSDETTPAPPTGAGGTPVPSATPEPPSAAEVEAAVGAQAGAEPTVVVDGEIPTTGTGTFAAQAGVVAVEAGPASTRLVVALRTASGDEETVPLEAFNEWSPLTMDVRDLSVTDPVSQTVLLPYLGASETSGSDGTFCLCSHAPKTLDGSWFTVYATLPPLDPTTTTVSVDVPGFPTVTDVAVTRS